MQHEGYAAGVWSLACSGMEWAVWELKKTGGKDSRSASQPIPMKW